MDIDPDDLREDAYHLAVAVANLLHYESLLEAAGIHFDPVSHPEMEERLRYALLEVEDRIERDLAQHEVQVNGSTGD